MNKEIYKIWLDSNASWTEWIKPIPFIFIDNNHNYYLTITQKIINYITYQKNVAIIIDLPNIDSICEGISIASIGYRPIPLYNGTIAHNTNSKVDNKIISAGLLEATKILRTINLTKDANPVFLLDSNRNNNYVKGNNIFDNTYDIYSQDLPSPKYFIKNNIDTIIVRTNKLQMDLKKILYTFQKENIKILLVNEYEEIKQINIKGVTHDKI